MGAKRNAGYWAAALLMFLAGTVLVCSIVFFWEIGPMIGPRGDIDYVDFTEARRHAADMDALLTQMLSLPCAGALISMVLFGGRITRWASDKVEQREELRGDAGRARSTSTRT